jgi:hypothetical protein
MDVEGKEGIVESCSLSVLCNEALYNFDMLMDREGSGRP